MSSLRKIAGKALDGGKLEQHFLAYLNNRMSVLLMMIEHPGIRREAQSILRQRYFLEDLYHHFLPSECPLRYRRAFEWLFRFLKVFPDVSPRGIGTAQYMVGLVYEAFGMELSLRGEPGGGPLEERFERRLDCVQK